MHLDSTIHCDLAYVKTPCLRSWISLTAWARVHMVPFATLSHEWSRLWCLRYMCLQECRPCSRLPVIVCPSSREVWPTHLNFNVNRAVFRKHRLHWCAVGMQKVNLWVLVLPLCSYLCVKICCITWLRVSVHSVCTQCLWTVKVLTSCTMQLLSWLGIVTRQFDCVWKARDPHLKNQFPLSQFFKMLSKTILSTMHLVGSFFVKENILSDWLFVLWYNVIQFLLWDICIGIKRLHMNTNHCKFWLQMLLHCKFVICHIVSVQSYHTFEIMPLIWDSAIHMRSAYVFACKGCYKSVYQFTFVCFGFLKPLQCHACFSKKKAF